MGGFIDAVVGFFSSIVTSVINIVKALFTLDFMALLFEPLRPICYLLGITDQDITNGSASLVKIFHKSEFPDTRTRLIAEKARNDTDLLTMYWGYSYTGQNQYDKYYYYGKSEFMDFLPDCNIGTSGIDGTTVVNALKDDLGLQDVFIERIDYGIPDNYLWSQWYLQENEDYSYSSNVVHINHIAYRLVNAVYDMDINKVIAYLTAVSSIREVITEYRTVTVEPVNNTTDKVTTTIKNKTVQYDDQDVAISSTIQTVSTSVSNVPKGTESNSETVTVLSDTVLPLNNPNITLQINPPRHVNFYQVLYKLPSSAIKLWLCSVDDSRYNLSNPDKRVEQSIELFPIVALRNSKVDVNEVHSGSNVSASFKREGRYAQSKELLSQVGVPIDRLIEEYRKNGSIGSVYDVFFIVGISPHQTIEDRDDDPVGNDFSQTCVAKLLYETVSYIYRCLPCIQKGQTYYVTFSESPFKGGVYWAGVPTTTHEGKIADLYEASMNLASIKISRVTVRKIHRFVRTQRVYTYEDSIPWWEDYYVYEYRMYNVEIEGSLTEKAIIDAVDSAYPTRTGTAMFVNELSTVPIYQVEYEDTSYYYNDDYYDSYQSTSYRTIYPNSSTVIPDSYATKVLYIDSLVVNYQIEVNRYRKIVLRDMHSLCFTDDVGQGLVSVSKVSEDGFFMPLAVKALEQFNLYDKNKLVSESFYMMFFAKQTQHLAFYQTPEFATFIKIIGICIIIIVQIFTWWSGPSTSLTLTAVLMAVLKMIVIAVALTLAIHIIQTYVKDPMLKAVLTAAAMVAAIYFGGGFDNFDFSSILQLVEIPCKIAEMYVGDEQKKLQEDYASLVEKNEQFEEQYTADKAAMNTGLEIEDVVQLQSATRMAGLASISVDQFFYLAKNVTPVDYVYDQLSLIYDYDSKYELAF